MRLIGVAFLLTSPADDAFIIHVDDLDELIGTISLGSFPLPFFSKGLDDFFFSELHAFWHEVGKDVYSMPVMVESDVEGFVGVFVFHAFNIGTIEQERCRL